MTAPTSHPNLRPAEAPATSPVLWTLLPWGAVVLFLVAQYVLFRGYVERELAWRYPSNIDQGVYLTNSYEYYETIRAEGLWNGLRHGFLQPTPNGALLEVEAALLHRVLGPSRLSALTVNFVHFALLQLVLFGTLRWYAGRWSAAFLGLGLLLASSAAFPFAGGMMDFRIDFAALCLFGTFLCVVVRSRTFQSWPWSLVAGAAAAVLVTTRHLTAVYLAGIFAGFVVLLCARWRLRRQDPEAPRVALRRLGGLAACGLVLAVLVGPVIWLKWPMIQTYYLGQFATSEGSVRTQEAGAFGLLGRVKMYCFTVFMAHAGWVFLTLSGGCVAAVLALGAARWWAASARRRHGQQAAAGAPPAVRPGLAAPAFAGLCLLVPLVVLALFPAPSPVVGGILVGPLVWLVALGVLHWVRPPEPRWRAAALGGGVLLALLALPVLGAGVYCTVRGFTRTSPIALRRADHEEVMQVYDQIAVLSREYGLTEPCVAFNTMSDHLCASLVTPCVYERKGQLISPKVVLGGSILSPSEAQAVEAVRQSDFAVLAATDGPGDGNSVYPFVQSMHDLRPRLLEACEQTHVAVRRFHLLGQEVVLYARRPARP